MVAKSHKPKSGEVYNILGLDVGDARVGMAIASSIAKIPAPLIIVPNNSKVFEGIKSVIDEHNVRVLVVGLPRDMTGNETEQSKITREFARRLKQRLDIAVSFADESLSSKLAEQERHKANRGPREHLDDIAACFILEEHFRSQK